MISRRETLLATLCTPLSGQSPPSGRIASSMAADIASFTFRAGFPQAPPRDVQDKLRDALSVRDNLATGRNDPADKARIQALSDSIEDGRNLAVQVGQYAFRNGGLIQRRAHSWAFETGALFRGDYDAGRSDDLLTIRIGEAGGAREIRGASLSGGAFLVRNPAYVPSVSPIAEQFARGGHAIVLDATGPGANIINYRISRASIAGGRGAVRLTGSDPGRTVAWSGIEQSTLINGVVAERAADGLMFRDNIAGGIETAYRFDLIEGAFCCTIDGGTTSNRNGALDVVNGSMWRIINCQMEHGVAFAGDMAVEATVIVRGTAYRSYLGIIRANNFGAGIGRVRNTIVLQNAAGTVIDENYFFPSDEADLRIESAASNTIVGARNMARGARTVRRTGSYTDLTRRLTVALPVDTAGKRAVGTRGIWHPATDVLTDFQNGWQPDGLEILLTEQGLVVFNGGLRGTHASGDVCTFPFWLRPHQNAWLHATVASDGSVRALKLDAATGALSIVGSLSGTELNLSNASFAAVLGLPYSIGP